jgi:cytochrome c
MDANKHKMYMHHHVVKKLQWLIITIKHQRFDVPARIISSLLRLSHIYKAKRKQKMETLTRTFENNLILYSCHYEGIYTQSFKLYVSALHSFPRFYILSNIIFKWHHRLTLIFQPSADEPRGDKMGSSGFPFFTTKARKIKFLNFLFSSWFKFDTKYLPSP